MITPIPIFIHTRSEPDLCPKCGKPENKIDTCGHCGHKYKYAKFSTLDKFVIIISIIGVVFAFCVISIFLLFSIFYWIDGMPLLKAFAKMAKNVWAVLSNIY